MITSVDEQRKFCKIKCLFLIEKKKPLSKLEIQENFLNLIKNIYRNLLIW